MNTEDQSEVVAFLSSPSTHGGVAVERIDTHASIVFLAGATAWKLKRAVCYDYLDFSTAARRKAMCDAELRLNVRTAPTVYRRVVAVTRQADGALALAGPGTPVDWVVEMARFEQEDLLDRRAARGALPVELMRRLAARLARFHQQAARRFDHGGSPGMTWVIDGNARGFREHAAFLEAGACTVLTDAAREVVTRHHDLLDGRRAQGFVRQCHGDLHLRNIVLLDGEPTLFDAVEFNDEIACIDVLYDLAFLLMDLWRLGLKQHANALWNSYLFARFDVEGIPLMPLFLSCRAAVRAKTSATSASLQNDAARTRDLQQLAGDYLRMAQQLLRPPRPCLVAIGGYSGSGKSTLARTLAPVIGAVPGAVIIRSDEVRKQLKGIDPLARLDPDAYTSDMSQRVYAAIVERAGRVLGGRHVAMADAVYARTLDRQTIEGVARATDVPFVGLWLDAPPSVLVDRIEGRRSDASDADAAVVHQQLASPAGPLSWHRLDASRAPGEVAHAATRILRQAVPEIDDTGR